MTKIDPTPDQRRGRVVALVFVALMVLGGLGAYVATQASDDEADTPTSITFNIPDDPIADEQVRSLREFWNSYTPAEDREFCRTYVEDFAPQYPNNVAAAAAFIRNYARANDVELRGPAEQFLRDRLQECLDEMP